LANNWGAATQDPRTNGVRFSSSAHSRRVVSIADGERSRSQSLFEDGYAGLRPFINVFYGAEGCINEIRGLMSEVSVRPFYKDQPHLESLATYERAGFDLYHLSVVNREPGGGLQELNAYLKRRRRRPPSARDKNVRLNLWLLTAEGSHLT
jgi:hypothetical protein